MLFVQKAVIYLPVSIFHLFGFQLLAQDFELIKIQTAYYPSEKIKESTADGEIGVFEWGAQVALPQIFKRNRTTILVHKFGYANLSVNIAAQLALSKVEATHYYHTMIYNFGLIQTLSKNWSLVVNLIPTLASDFEKKLSGNDLLFQANGFVVKTKNEKLKYGFGLAFTTRFGRQLVIPMGLLKYSTRKFTLDFVFPNKLTMMFKAKMNNLFYGFKAGINGGVFNNSSEIQTVSNIINEVGYSRFNLGPAITWRLKDAININLQCGITVGRKLEFVGINDEIIDRTPQSAPFIGLSISLAPKIDNPEAAPNN